LRLQIFTDLKDPQYIELLELPKTLIGRLGQTLKICPQNILFRKDNNSILKFWLMLVLLCSYTMNMHIYTTIHAQYIAIATWFWTYRLRYIIHVLMQWINICLLVYLAVLVALNLYGFLKMILVATDNIAIYESIKFLTRLTY